jgi:GTP cyclohydrolase III
VSISKEKEATLASRNEEVRKLANRIDSLLTDGYVAVAHDTPNNITKKKKKVTGSSSMKSGITAVNFTTSLHNKNDDIGGGSASSYATMYSLSK